VPLFAGPRGPAAPQCARNTAPRVQRKRALVWMQAGLPPIVQRVCTDNVNKRPVTLTHGEAGELLGWLQNCANSHIEMWQQMQPYRATLDGMLLNGQ
jgi:hypothetical protein